MRIDVVTIFPRIFESPLRESLLGRAIEAGLLDVRVHDLRDSTTDKHRQVDDESYGGGPGMVLKPEPVFAAVESLGAGDRRTLLLSPAGRRLDQDLARELATEPWLVLICGRYEGVDERVSETVADEELSVGDYVLSGGEPAALVVTDAIVRLLPGVLGDEDAPARDSFARGLLEHPQYTRPEVFRGAGVPDVLRSGDHGRVARWQQVMSLWRTWRRRPDLLETADLTPEEQKWTDGFRQGRSPADFLD